MKKRKSNVGNAEYNNSQPSQNVYERTGSTEHNDYKITGRNEVKKAEEKDEDDSYQNYNGNSEANDPGRTK